MPIVVPGVATNYPSPLVSLASTFGQEPKEGRRQIPVEISWGTMGGSNFLCAFNLQNSANTKEWSQLCAVHVDNSGCGSDIEFIFTDTSETVVVPAYEPYVLVPLFSRSLQFFVQAGINSEVVESNDVTRFTLFNFVPPPVVIPAAVEQSVVSNAALAADGATNTVMIATPINGTLESIYLYRASPAAGLAGPGAQTWAITDGASSPKTFFQGTFAGGNLSSWNVPLIQLSGLNMRFTNGLSFKQTGAALGGTYSLSLGYRTP